MFWSSKIQLLVKYIRFGKGELVEYINGPLAGEHMLNDLILGAVLPTIVAIFVMESLLMCQKSTASDICRLHKPLFQEPVFALPPVRFIGSQNLDAPLFFRR